MNLRSSGSGVHAVWFGDMGDYTAHWEFLGRIPSQGGPQADRTTTSDRTGRWVGISPTGRSDGGGGIKGGGYLRLPPP